MLVGILCRICRCLAVGPREHEPSAKPEGDDDAKPSEKAASADEDETKGDA